MTKFSPEDIQEIAEVMGAVVEAKVEVCVHQAFHTYKQDYFVEPEGHYQDHLQMKECREKKDDWSENHRIISDLKKGDKLENAVLFAGKLQKREKLISVTAIRGTVAIMLAIVANWICNAFGVKIGLEKLMTIFR